MSDKNLSLWESVKHVEDKYTKSAKVDGNSQTSISTLYPVYLMTKQLGPIGKLWKYEVVREEFVNTTPVKIGKEFMLDNGSMVWEQDHTLFMRIYTRDDTGQPFEVACEQYGHTKYRYMTGSGYMKVDHEYAKKSCSDALKKCLSLFGVCADVYMGDFDDQEYRTDVQHKIAVEKADKNNEEELKQFEEMKKELDDAINAFTKIPNEQSLKKVYAQKARYFKARQESPKLGRAANKYLQDLDLAMKDAIENLKNKDAA